MGQGLRFCGFRRKLWRSLSGPPALRAPPLLPAVLRRRYAENPDHQLINGCPIHNTYFHSERYSRKDGLIMGKM